MTRTIVYVDAEVLAGAVAQCMSHAQAIQDVCRIKARIVAELAWNHLECARIRVDEQLGLARDCTRCASELPAGGIR